MTHPEALVEKLAKTIYDANPETDGTWENNPIPFDWRSSHLASERARAAAWAVLDLFEVREERGIDPARPFSEQLSAMSMRAAGIPEAEKPTHHRYTLTTDWEPTDA